MSDPLGLWKEYFAYQACSQCYMFVPVKEKDALNCRVATDYNVANFFK